MPVDIQWNRHPVPTDLFSQLTMFLVSHEKEMDPDESDFIYLLAKLLKPTTVHGKRLMAIMSDYDMGLFFKRTYQKDIPVLWKDHNRVRPLIYNEALPIEVRVTKKGMALICEMTNWKAWNQNPLSWIPFRADRDIFCFANGKMIANPSRELLNFIDRFLDGARIKLSFEQAQHFIKSVYKPYRHQLRWRVQADFATFVPEQIVPIPVLMIKGENGKLSLELVYRYRSVIVTAATTDKTIVDPDTGRRIERVIEMESTYQKDLMDLFMEHKLPFMLTNPGDQATLLDELVPILRGRAWEVECDVPDLVIAPEPFDLTFAFSNAAVGKDWFHFEPSCEINGQKFSLQELARLIVESQGYVKTQSGYIRLSDRTQGELRLLEKMGGLKVGKAFKKAEMLPFLMNIRMTGQSEESQELLDRFSNPPDFTSQDGDTFHGELRGYQEDGVRWMRMLHHLQLGGILADDMGLGKTVQALAFLTRIKRNGPSLVVAPSSVVYNWKQEIARFTPDFSTLVYVGDNRTDELKRIVSTDLMITSYGILKRDIDLIKHIPFDCVFVDEAQTIKNPGTQVSKAVKSVDAKFRLAMTGTPVENHLSDMWNIFDFVMPGYLGSAAAFDATVSDEKDVTRHRIKPFVLRREKRTVLDTLPEKTEIVVRCDMSAEQTQLYQSVLKATRSGIQTLNGQRDRLSILAALLKLRQICIDPSLLKEVGGAFGGSGKMDVLFEHLSELTDEGHKVVVFSQFTGVLDRIDTFLTENHIRGFRLDGSTPSALRQDRINEFQELDEPAIFVISLKAGGVGINLTAADYVIHVDPWWNPAVESQATDRVHRMGQKNKVIVYKLITTGTIEEKILQLQDEKRHLFSEWIDGQDQSGSALSMEDIKELLA